MRRCSGTPRRPALGRVCGAAEARCPARTASGSLLQVPPASPRQAVAPRPSPPDLPSAGSGRPPAERPLSIPVGRAARWRRAARRYVRCCALSASPTARVGRQHTGAAGPRLLTPPQRLAGSVVGRCAARRLFSWGRPVAGARARSPVAAAGRLLAGLPA
eukprot:scaffold14483_cov105-Isochrysis_galbana.AAC.2